MSLLSIQSISDAILYDILDDILMQVNHFQCWHPQSINMWNSLKYNNAFTRPTDEKGKNDGKKKIELFSSSYKFLLQNCK